jgi:hypothetical protein
MWIAEPRHSTMIFDLFDLAGRVDQEELMRTIPLLAVLGLTFLVAGPELAAAEDTDEEAARAAFKEGVDHFEAKRYEEALASFRMANEIAPSWKLRFNIGQCEAALKRYGLAIEEFEAYLAEGGDDVAHERREFVLEELRRLREMVGSIEVKGRPGLAVHIDGLDRGATPLGAGVRVTAGKGHEVRVLDGERTVLVQKVTVGGGQDVVIEVDAEAVGPESEGQGSAAGEPSESEPEDGDGGGISPAFFWIGAGATTAFAGVTLWMNFAAKSKYQQLEDDPSDQTLRDEGEKAQVVGITFLALTGAAAVTTGILAAFTDFGGEEPGAEADLALAPWASGQGGGLTLEGRF